MKILMVCLGNICRSPLAEGILTAKTKHLNVIVDSAGTGAWHAGNRADTRMRNAAEKRGIILSSIARQIKREDFATL